MSKAIFLEKKPDDKSLFRLSVSKVKTYDQCQLKYKFQYIDKLPRKEWDFHIFGKFMHEVLEHFHVEILKGNQNPDHVIMGKVFNSSIVGELGRKLSKDDKNYCFTLANKYLKIRKQQKENGTLANFLEAEREFNILIDNKVVLNGFIDVIKQDVDGVLHVADYKTSSRKDFLKKDLFQLKVYAYVMCLECPDLEKVRCSYIMLKHDFDEIVKVFHRQELMQIEDYLLEKSESIQKEKLYRPSPGALCFYCDGLEKCEEGKQKLIFLGKIKEEYRFGEVSF